VPIFYKLFDWGTDFQRLHPEYGPVGSVQFVRWADINPAPGVYRWEEIDSKLALEAPLKVTLPDGREIPKPVVIQVFPFISSYPGWRATYYDATPGWVYNQIEAYDPTSPRPIVGGRKVGHALQGCDTTAVMPMFDSLIWREAYYRMVRAFGARYDKHPQVTCVVANVGLDGETQPVKDLHCQWNTLLDQQAGGVRYRFNKYILEAMAVYREAFPNKPLFIANTPGGSGIRWETSLYASRANPPIGLKNASMWIDHDSYQGHGDYVGMWDMINTYSTTLPIWVESFFGLGSKEHRYWAFMAGLHSHPDMMSLHPEFQTQSEPAWLTFVARHLGVRLDNTPDVWTVLRDAEYPLQSWGKAGVSGHMGDWTFWLYRLENAPQSATERVWRKEMPAAQESIYSRQTRRTRQGQGQLYMSFNVDDGYPYAGQKPAIVGGSVVYDVEVTLLNLGEDTAALQYRAWDGRTVSQTVRKGAALGAVGEWVTVRFLVRDGYWANNMPGGADFRLSCENDGDEYVHMVRVVGRWEGGNAPTGTPQVSPTATPTGVSPTATPTGVSPTATPTGVSPTATPTGVSPLPTATRTATPTATPTPTLPLTPAATPTPWPDAMRHDPLAGTYLDQEAARIPRYTAPYLAVRQGDTRVALLRFDLTTLPAQAVIERAVLSLYAAQRSHAAPLALRAHKVLRPWEEREATWTFARPGDPWLISGCGDPIQDASWVVVDEGTLSEANRWVDLDVTALAREWVAAPEANYGLLLRSRGTTAVEYGLASLRYPDAAFRPRLWVSWRAPSSTATPQVSPTPTPTGVSPTATPAPITPTATGAPVSPTGTPQVSPTATPTGVSPTATPTGVSPTATPTGVSPTATPTITPTPATLLLRQGEGYRGVRDTYLDAWTEDARHHAAESLIARQGAIRMPLLRFDLRQLPSPSSIRRATLGLYALSRSNPNALTLRVARLNRAWEAENATWNQASATEAWFQAGARDSESDRAARLYASEAVAGVERWVRWDITDLVQEWASGEAANFGLALLGEGGISVEYLWASSEAPAEALRPYLEIEYLPVPPTPRPSPTRTVTPILPRTPTLTPLPPRGRITLQQGAEDYRGAEDTTLDRWNPQVANAAADELVVRQGGARVALLRFALEALPSQSRIRSAQLRFYVSSRSAEQPLPVRVYGLAHTWVATEATYQRASRAAAWYVEGAGGLGSDLLAIATTSVTLDQSGAWVSCDVTNLAQRWVSFPALNYGMALRADSGAAVEYVLASAEAHPAARRPQLILEWEPAPTVTGTPPTPTATATATPTATAAPSPTPTPLIGKVLLQQGLANYRGTRDAWLDSWNQDAATGQEGALIVRWNDLRSALLRFDLAVLPAGANVTQATLSLWSEYASNAGGLTLQAYALRRPWNEDATTWLEADRAVPWGAPGANDLLADRQGRVAGEVAVAGAQQWVNLDVTSAVSAWHKNPAENYGLVLKGQGTVNVEYLFTSAQGPLPHQRPKLQISYELAAPRQVQAQGSLREALPALGTGLGVLALALLLARVARRKK
jgi:hypothetical protein